jgi:DNA polymerase III delta prime subunit
MSVEENTSKKLNNYLMTEKYRPPSVRSMILPEAYRTYFNKIVDTKNIPNLLLYSSNPGSGKTSIAKALCKDINARFLYINISTDSGINTLRTTIERFATNKSIDGRQKVIILDEFDGASYQLQKGMKGFVEQFHKNCRFVFTTNFINKIIEPLREGRTQLFNFDMMKEEYSKEMKPKIKDRLLAILDKEEIDYEDRIVNKLIDNCYPNIRKMISSIQKCNNMYGKLNESVLTNDTKDEDFINLILSKKINQSRKYFLENGYSFDEIYVRLYKELVPMLEPKYQAEAIILIAEYMDRHTRAIDPEITFMALLAEIMMMVK